MFQDEARFGRIQDARRCWAQSKCRPLIKAQLVREYTYAYAAVCPATGESSSLELPYANTECMNLFLSEVSKTYNGYNILMFMDQASWHKAGFLKVPDNIQIEFIPPYSPELNPTEMFWKAIRSRFFRNKYFQSLEGVSNLLYEALKFYIQNPNEIKTTVGFGWIVSAS
jgi:hypothetical protein